MKRLFALFLSLLFLCSCAAKPDRASAEEVEKLRQMYPYNDRLGVYPLHPQDRYYPDLESITTLWSWLSSAVVVLEITGDWYREGYYVPPFEDSDPEVAERIRQQQEAQLIPGGCEVIDAVIEQVLWTSPDEDWWHGKELKAGEQVTLYFEMGEWYGSPTYIGGNRYVCCLKDYRHDKGFSEDKSIFLTNPYATFHLSHDDVLVSATNARGQDACTGMYLHAFEKLICEALDGQMEE